MYCRLASKKVSFPNLPQSPLLFCSLLNDRTLLLVHHNHVYTVYPLTAQYEDPPLAQGKISSEAGLTHCQRVAKNRCLLLTDKLSMMTVLELVDGKQVRLGEIYNHEGEIFNSLRNCVGLHPMTQNLFAISNQLQQNRTLHLLFYRLIQNCEAIFPYQASSKTIQLQLLDQAIILKHIKGQQQFALFEQQRTKDEEYEIKIVEAVENTIQKVIDVETIATKEDTLVDVMGYEHNGYYVFVRKQNIKQGKIWGQVHSIRLHPTQNYYTQLINRLHHFPFDPLNHQSVIAVDPKADYFLTTAYLTPQQSTNICDNSLQVRKLSTGQIIEETGCNLKEIEMGPKNEVMVDYGRQIEVNEEIMLHIRKIVKKQMIYRHFLDNKGVFSKIQPSNAFSNMILSCL